MATKNKGGSAVLLEVLLCALVIAGMGIGFCAAYKFFFQAAYPIRYEEEVRQYSADSRLPEALVYAVIRTESGFQPQAESSVSARGLMQITQDTFEWAQYRVSESEDLHFDDLFEPELNIRYGTAIMRLLIDEFGTVENALCAYHAGWGNAQKWLEDPMIAPDGTNIQNIPFGDTRRYVGKVLETRRLYETLYDMA